MTLTTASAAALTIGLASPALALATVGGLGAVHNQTGFGAHHQGAVHNGIHHQVALPRDDDDDDGDGGDDYASEDNSACCEHGHVKVSHPAPAPRRHYVPMGAVRSGFGGTQGMNAPLGLAGLSLLVGGAGLLPLARRRLQASARS
jgi:hypothetical protein